MPIITKATISSVAYLLQSADGKRGPLMINFNLLNLQALFQKQFSFDIGEVIFKSL